MLTARLGTEIIRAGANLKDKDFVYRCRDKDCPHPECELVVGRGLRIPHFRHKVKSSCGCQEGETEWHLEWKSHFDRVEEDMGVDPITGEKNRADAVVDENFVLEFQHSPIKEEEQSNRERFYKSKGGMLWIVDANKKRMLARLDRACRDREIIRCQIPALWNCGVVHFPEEVFGPIWSERSVGVVFDYGPDHDLIFLYPGRAPEQYRQAAIIKPFKREELIRSLKESSSPFAKTVQERIDEFNQEQAEEKARQQREADEKARLQQLIEEKGKEAWRRAIEKQRMTPRGKTYFEPLGIGNLYVDARGFRYHLENGQLVLQNAQSSKPFIRRRNWRM